MLRAVNVVIRRFASTECPRKIIVTSRGSIAALHPPQEFPYEHSRPIELSDNSELKSSRLSTAARSSAVPREPINAELKEIFYTTKHEWFTRSREDRLRQVAAPTPRRK